MFLLMLEIVRNAISEQNWVFILRILHPTVLSLKAKGIYMLMAYSTTMADAHSLGVYQLLNIRIIPKNVLDGFTNHKSVWISIYRVIS